jgi:hypothetical protein
MIIPHGLQEKHAWSPVQPNAEMVVRCESMRRACDCVIADSAGGARQPPQVVNAVRGTTCSTRRVCEATSGAGPALRLRDRSSLEKILADLVELLSSEGIDPACLRISRTA